MTEDLTVDCIVFGRNGVLFLLCGVVIVGSLGEVLCCAVVAVFQLYLDWQIVMQFGSFCVIIVFLLKFWCVFINFELRIVLKFFSSNIVF